MLVPTRPVGKGHQTLLAGVDAVMVGYVRLRRCNLIARAATAFVVLGACSSQPLPSALGNCVVVGDSSCASAHLGGGAVGSAGNSDGSVDDVDNGASGCSAGPSASQCQACVSANCCAYLNACTASTECSNLLSCVLACAGAGVSACIDGCNGRDVYKRQADGGVASARISASAAIREVRREIFTVPHARAAPGALGVAGRALTRRCV